MGRVMHENDVHCIAVRGCAFRISARNLSPALGRAFDPRVDGHRGPPVVDHQDVLSVSAIAHGDSEVVRVEQVLPIDSRHAASEVGHRLGKPPGRCGRPPHGRAVFLKRLLDPRRDDGVEPPVQSTRQVAGAPDEGAEAGFGAVRRGMDGPVAGPRLRRIQRVAAAVSPHRPSRPYAGVERNAARHEEGDDPRDGVDFGLRRFGFCRLAPRRRQQRQWLVPRLSPHSCIQK